VAKNFLQLTNDALSEAGVYLDPLTSVNFASPPDTMYTRFKNWINQALREVILDRKEWQFQSKQAMMIVSPRILVERGDRSVAPPAGSTYEGTETGATFEVVATTTLDGDWAAGDAEAYIDYIELDGQWKFNEPIDEITPTPANTDVFVIKGWGKYDLASSFADLDEVNPTSFYLQSTGGSTVQDNDDHFDVQPLYFVPRTEWTPMHEQVTSGSTLRYITIGANGHYEFWPRLEKQYVLKFTYSALPINLSAYSDTTTLPAFYEDIIIWRAVMFYAAYDKQPALERYAKERYRFYRRVLGENKLGKFSWGRNLFNDSGW
jgi:hypothetical protein